jgi:N6-L-threonylcarbamoyladenine synthase
MPIIILAIESSCDDTSASVIIDGQVCSNIIASQNIHQLYGGVVPELASRDHEKNIIPVVDLALKQANIKTEQLSAIAFTAGPGLIGSLLVGVTFAKGLALSHQIPLIEVNHLDAHIMAHLIDDPKPIFPFLCLLISGGHTQIVLVKEPLVFEKLGETSDDAAGEAFDKTAKLLGLEYPGGPLIDKYAKLGEVIYKFPIPSAPGFNFSFSGFKTSVLYFLQKETRLNPSFIEHNLNNICASIQHTIIEIVFQKSIAAIKQTGVKSIAIAGGVASNSGVRHKFTEYAKESGIDVFIPQFQYCTDNAAMIAITANYLYLKESFSDHSVVPFAKG